MFCRKCGSQNEDNAYKCIKCGEVLQQAVAGGPPRVTIPNYLAQSILVTILRRPPFGIPAIVFAAQVNGKLASGDIPGATLASQRAKMWSWISFFSGSALPGSCSMLSSASSAPWSPPSNKTAWAIRVIGLAIFVGIALLAWLDPTTSGVFPPCPIHAITGLHCPGCGSLRPTHQLLNGNLAELRPVP